MFCCMVLIYCINNWYMSYIMPYIYLQSNSHLSVVFYMKSTESSFFRVGNQCAECEKQQQQQPTSKCNIMFAVVVYLTLTDPLRIQPWSYNIILV